MTELHELALQLQENCKTYTDCSGCPFYCDGCTIYGVPSEWEVEDMTCKTPIDCGDYYCEWCKGGRE